VKLKNKITLLTSVWLILILICVDLAVYFVFIHVATQNEIESMHNKAAQIIEKIGPEAVMRKGESGPLLNFAPDDTVVRVVNPASETVSMINQEVKLELPPPKFSKFDESELTEINEQRMLWVRVPVRSGGTVIGTFEMGQKMDALEENMGLLITILICTSAGAVLLCLIGGTWLSKTVIRPISDSIRTMEEIESSLTFKRIPTPSRTKDELYKMTATFNRMMGRLEESFHKQQQFVSDASHELSTTLTIIEGYANMLRRWGAEDKSIQRESIESIYEESKRMRVMTQQLLDLASSQQGMGLAKEPFDLLACCEQAAALFRKLHTRKIRVFAALQQLIINADPVKIKQLIIILIDNALKYSKSVIEIHVSAKEGEAVIRVKDYGIGIPQDEIPLVFERFYRVDRARHRKTGGTGLGLPIAKSIVREHNGTIHIDSEVGAGTEVIVRLPLTQKGDEQDESLE